jgi:hypothetical protein
MHGTTQAPESPPQQQPAQPCISTMRGTCRAPPSPHLPPGHAVQTMLPPGPAHSLQVVHAAVDGYTLMLACCRHCAAIALHSPHTRCVPGAPAANTVMSIDGRRRGQDSGGPSTSCNAMLRPALLCLVPPRTMMH